MWKQICRSIKGEFRSRKLIASDVIKFIGTSFEITILSYDNNAIEDFRLGYPLSYQYQKLTRETNRCFSSMS